MTWATLPTFVDNDVPDEDDLNDFLGNLEHLHTAPVDSYQLPNGSSDITTTSATWTYIGSDWNKTFTVEGGRVLVLFVAAINNLQIDMEMDGTRLGEAGTGGHGSMTAPSLGNYRIQMAFFHTFFLSAGSHTLKMCFRVPTSGTGTIYAANQPRLYVVKQRGG